ncbi:MAG: 50S ribosomal protein L28 [Kiritimatiellia bacterium]
MSKSCEKCGKTTQVGNRIVRHGLAKKKGGIGMHTTGITRRRFMPNLQKVRIMDKGTVRRCTICAQCLKNGLVQKA